jgi:flagellar hook-length control protein FliK
MTPAFDSSASQASPLARLLAVAGPAEAAPAASPNGDVPFAAFMLCYAPVQPGATPSPDATLDLALVAKPEPGPVDGTLAEISPSDLLTKSSDLPDLLISLSAMAQRMEHATKDQSAQKQAVPEDLPAMAVTGDEALEIGIPADPALMTAPLPTADAVLPTLPLPDQAEAAKVANAALPTLPGANAADPAKFPGLSGQNPALPGLVQAAPLANAPIVPQANQTATPVIPAVAEPAAHASQNMASVAPQETATEAPVPKGLSAETQPQTSALPGTTVAKSGADLAPAVAQAVAQAISQPPGTAAAPPSAARGTRHRTEAEGNHDKTVENAAPGLSLGGQRAPVPAAPLVQAAPSGQPTAGRPRNDSLATSAIRAVGEGAARSAAKTALAGEPGPEKTVGADAAFTLPPSTTPSLVSGSIPASLSTSQPDMATSDMAPIDMAPISMTSQNWEAEMVERVTSQVTGDGTVIDIALTPENLGRVEVKVEIRNGSAEVSFTTETREAARLFSQSEQQLSDLLQRNGLNLAQQDSQQRQQARNQGTEPRPDPRNLLQAEAPEHTDQPAAKGMVNLMA